MKETLLPPPATASREAQADWLELSALLSPAGEISRREFIGDLRLSGTTDALAESTQEIESDGGDSAAEQDAVIEGIADGAFEDLEERASWCGDAYPFTPTRNTVQCRNEHERYSYTFLALLSGFGKDAGPSGLPAAHLFEDLSATALERYFGGVHPHVRTIAFGFPRRQQTGFADALDALCVDIGEGLGHRDEPISIDQKDAKLDIVGWRCFEDTRPGKLIAFGQCATGNDWQGKLTELPPAADWCRLWMRESPYVDPIRLFFVPHHIELDQWRRSCIYGGILFDRCRIARLTTPISSNTYPDWSTFVLQQQREK